MRGKSSGHAIAKYTTRILKFGKMGEKTGWTYIVVPPDIADKLFPGNKRSFRVKGKLDDHLINGVAIMPMGDGGFILPVNVGMRKGIGKRDGAMLQITLQYDEKKRVLSKELMECLSDEPEALLFFKQLSASHQHYFSKWIDSAKSADTKAKRIARTLNALSKKMHYGEMIRAGI